MGFFQVSLQTGLCSFLLLCVAPSHSASAQDTGSLPSYQVIFDDFNYDATGYPDSTGGDLLFGENAWYNRSGASTFQDQAWYYYQWRWHALGRTIHPSGEVLIDNNEPYSFKLRANAGYTRRYDSPNEVPLQVQSGFLRESGTWSLNARFDDLELIPYFTQAFWIISPIATSKERTGVAEWSEFNFEWQNWFALNLHPGGSSADTLLINDIWAPGNLWVDALKYEGQPFPGGQLPAIKTRTYMANGIRMYSHSAGAIFDNGQTAGGIPLRNQLLPNAPPFTCFLSSRKGITHISDPLACMDFIADQNSPDHWVQLTIQYDGNEALFSIFSEQDEGSEYVFMSSRVALNERSLPLMVTIGIHPPNQDIVLYEGESSTLEIDWFYFSPRSDLSVAEIRQDVSQFKSRGWPRVNLDEEKLSYGELTPWRIEEFNPPHSGDNRWSVRPNMRLTNGIEIQWNYRTRNNENDFFGDWSGWINGGFHFLIDPLPLEAEVDIRIRDHHATDLGERPRWANTSCIRYNYLKKESSVCAGGVQENARISLDQIPREVLIDQVYPNPVTSTATIRFGLPQRATVEIDVFDLLGRALGEVLRQEMPAGYHKITWFPGDLPAGRYFLNLRSGYESRTLPVIVAR